MQAHLQQAGSSSLQLTLDRAAAMTIVAALRFAGRFHETVRKLADRIADPIESALAARRKKAVGSRRGATPEAA
jgi:hypothetical protein